MTILCSNQAEIDLVFSDLQMPGERDGFILAQWVRKNRPGVQVMLTTGDANKVEAARNLCEGAPFFAKPYDFGEIVAGIRRLLTERNLT
jgi:DNA-binding NtrC family response regulator